MIRYVNVRGKRIPAVVTPRGSAYRAGLANMVREIESIYLEAMGWPHVNHFKQDGSVRNLLGNRTAIVAKLRATDRARGFSQNGLTLAIDGFLEYFGGSAGLVDQFGRAVIGESNKTFDALIQAAGNGAPVQARIYAIDHRAKTSDMGRFLDGFRRDNTALIRKLVGRQVLSTENVLANGYGEHVDVLAARIREATGTTESHAELLARDQTLKANADVQAFRAKSLGAEQYTWITSNDERVRGRPGGKWADAQSNHWRLHGKVFSYNDPPVTNETKGIRLNPGRDFQCRCTATPNLSHIFE